jgi:hypothetical protein
MTIDASQNVGVGVTPSAWRSINKALQVGTVSNISNIDATVNSGVDIGYNYFFNSGGNAIYLINAASSYYRQQGGNHFWNTAASGTAGNTISFTQSLAVGRGTTLALEGASSVAGTGITFPATQNASSDANTLDDYEEGTFSPTIAGGFSTAPSSYATQRGAYRKIGSYVYFQIQIDATGTVADGSALQIGGLPFTCANASLVGHGGAFLNYGNSFDTNAGDTFHIINASTTIGVYTNAGSARAGNASGVNINNEFLLCGFYITA